MFSFNFSGQREDEKIEKEHPINEVHVFANEPILYAESEFDCFNFESISIKSLKRRNVLSTLENNTDFDILEAEKSHSDLLPGIYEGGLKIWECTFDLGNYIVNNMTDVFYGKTVLDLGCGAGILGILALKLGACTVHFLDYNSGVISNLTGPNVIANGFMKDKVRFWAGDWNGFLFPKAFDIILTCETIYNPGCYSKLHQVFNRVLKTKGSIFLAAKTYYFGVGGSIGEFLELVDAERVFSHRNLWSSDKGVKSEIILLEKN